MKKRWKHSSIMFNFSHWWVSKLFFSLTNWKLKIFIKIIKFYGNKFREFNLLVRNLNWNYLQNSIVFILRGEIFTATEFIVFGNLVFISIWAIKYLGLIKYPPKFPFLTQIIFCLFIVQQISHILWGVWSLVQSKISTLEVDFKG